MNSSDSAPLRPTARWIPVATAALLSLAGTAAAQQRAPADAGVRWTSSPLAEAASVEGIVYEAGTGRPVAGASVAATGGGRTRTDQDGRFLVDTPSAGGFALSVEAGGYVPLRERLTARAGRGVLAAVGVLPNGAAVEPGIRWTATVDVPPGRVTGRVLEASTGRPIPEAQVRLSRSGDGGLTDDEGWFNLDVAGGGGDELVVTRLGMAEQRDRITLAPGEGAWAEAVLTPERMPDCGLVLTPLGSRRGVRLVARDLLTGRSPLGDLTLRVGDGVRTDSTKVRSSGDPSFVILGAGSRLLSDGPLVAEVTSERYATWQASDVWLDETECTPDARAVLRAWLLPLR